MLTEVDLGVNIDLINPDTYAIDHNGKFSTIFIFCLKLIHPLLEKDYVILYHVLMTVNIWKSDMWTAVWEMKLKAIFAIMNTS